MLKQRGATQVVAYITHPVLSGPAVERIQTSALDEIVVTDTIPLSDGREGLPAHSAALRGGAAGRDAAPHQRSRLGLLALFDSPGLNEATSPARGRAGPWYDARLPGGTRP